MDERPSALSGPYTEHHGILYRLWTVMLVAATLLILIASIATFLVLAWMLVKTT